jgi:hypothetical protein
MKNGSSGKSKKQVWSNVLMIMLSKFLAIEAEIAENANLGLQLNII